MLSVENPPPESDPPLPCPLKKKKLVNSPQLDPSSSSSLSLSSSLDHHQSRVHHHSSSHSQTPNFCIRDYVFAVRRKDVEKNWPFSPENLQLCLKHGVKHPLPPFQSFGPVKDRSLKPCTVEAASDVAKMSDDDHPTSRKVRVLAGKLKPCSENTLPSTATSANQSEIECLESDQPVSDQSTVKQYPPSRSKTENTTTIRSPTGKKCRLVVKFGSSSAEDVASELMASSKTCPVCKNFSSSSNTTLNAHIDQCLASGSKPVSDPSSRLAARHKIKPRKIRLMTDIYTTAKECTLEELDRRNGTSWAAMGGEKRSEGVNEEGKGRRASMDLSRDSACDEANVYVDANGTKVRILSKLDSDGTMAKMPVKGGKLFSVKKKSRHGKRKHKYLKLVPQSTKLLPPKAHSSQVQVDQEEEGYSQEETRKEEFGAPKRIKLLSLPGSSRQWTPMKSTTVTKEPSKRGCRKYPSSGNDEPCLRQDSFARRSKIEKVMKPLLPMRRNTDNSRNVRSSLYRTPTSRSSENGRNFVSSLGRRRICSSAGLEKSTKGSPGVGSRTLDVPSPGKKVPIRGQSASENKLSAGKTRFSFKNMGSWVLDEGDDEEFVARERSANWENVQDGSENRYQMSDSSFGTSEERLGSENFRCGNGEMADSSPRELDPFDDETSTSVDSDSESDKNDDVDDVLKDLDCREITQERAVTSLSQFLEPDFIRRSHSETLFVSSDASSDGQALLHSSEPDFLGGQEGYSARDDDSRNMIHDHATCMDMDMDMDKGSSFPDVDPIPIPGPPGSFLPSPRDMMMASEDFPGHSSLTTSPVRSSEDIRDFIDRVSSDSPLSMASTVSNSRPDHMKYFEQFSSAGMALGQEKKDLNSAVSSLRSSVEIERKPESENLNFDGFAIEKRQFELGSHDQPCCCQRRERSLPPQGFISLNFQESQLLKRRTMASSAEDRQMGVLLDMNPSSSDHPRFESTAPPRNPFTALDSGPGHTPDLLPMRRPLSGTDGTITSPYGSNPVLRLMGKNLMVINTDEKPSTSHGFSTQVAQNQAQAHAGTFHQSHYSVPLSLFNPQDSSSSAHSQALNPQVSDRFSPIKLTCNPEDPRKIHLSSSLYFS
ncbi:PREDICTED: uncharacterized protein LOC104810306 [Tarenaya hassleriana]|uniref:uncharacterized protein LOC104810306 n=1 Tax=Tarenaya hassleriana TaxID=28532 RepID=UPI00053C128D|nr:PREDICTED: uncharacterized protein LOC104810306 [Tarenaya hassleriana]